MQDLVDAIRVYEADLDNLDIPKICDASGKEDLGGGRPCRDYGEVVELEAAI